MTIEPREQSAFVGFPSLPFELALALHRDEVLRVKIEIDTNPLAGAGLTTTAVVLLQLHHHDRASLLAGKLYAVLNTKERDFFDLLQRPRLAITQSHAAQPCACANRLAWPDAGR